MLGNKDGDSILTACTMGALAHHWGDVLGRVRTRKDRQVLAAHVSCLLLFA